MIVSILDGNINIDVEWPEDMDQVVVLESMVNLFKIAANEEILALAKRAAIVYSMEINQMGIGTAIIAAMDKIAEKSRIQGNAPCISPLAVFAERRDI